LSAGKKYKRDLSSAGERSLFAIEAILGREFPIAGKQVTRTKVLEQVVLALTFEVDIINHSNEKALALAKDKNTNRFMLERLAGHPNWQVRVALLSNPSLPAYIARRLSDDDVPEVKAAVIRRIEEDLKKKPVP